MKGVFDGRARPDVVLVTSVDERVDGIDKRVLQVLDAHPYVADSTPPEFAYRIAMIPKEKFHSLQRAPPELRHRNEGLVAPNRSTIGGDCRHTYIIHTLGVR